MATSDLIDDLLGVLRRQFYPDSTKEFMQQRKLLIRAITHPAAELEKNSVRLSDDRYKEIVLGIIKGIQQHGKTGEIRFFAGYFLYSVQQHMKHNGADYYEEGKTSRTVAELVMLGLKKAPKSNPEPSGSNTLAEINYILKAPRRSKSKKTASPRQQTLF